MVKNHNLKHSNQQRQDHENKYHPQKLKKQTTYNEWNEEKYQKIIENCKNSKIFNFNAKANLIIKTHQTLTRVRTVDQNIRIKANDKKIENGFQLSKK